MVFVFNFLSKICVGRLWKIISHPLALSATPLLITWTTLLTRPWNKDPEFETDILNLYAFLLQVLLFGWVLSMNIYVWDAHWIEYQRCLNYTISGKATALYVCFFAWVSFFSFGFNAMDMIEVQGELQETVSFCAFIIFASTWLLLVWKSASVRWWLWKIVQALVCLSGWPWLGFNFGNSYTVNAWTSSVSATWSLELMICTWMHDPPFAGLIYPEAESTEDADIKHCYVGDNVWFGKTTLYAVPYYIKFIGCMYSFVVNYRRGKSGWDLWKPLVNAGKYSSNLLLLATATWKTYVPHDRVAWNLWIIVCVVKTTWSWLWDTFQDWEIQTRLRNNDGAFPRWYYILACIINLVLRVTWTKTFAPEGWGIANLNVLFAGLEILRRGQWNILRVEREALKPFGLGDYVVPLLGPGQLYLQTIEKVSNSRPVVYSGSLKNDNKAEEKGPTLKKFLSNKSTQKSNVRQDVISGDVEKMWL